ncbi:MULTISPECIES: sensor histidine kinase [Bradyrhizobium]|uniref:sensor histidine kinase n=1 Tax=Bradyrhizobium TaxID=374 RepID=UPI0004B39431|nr:MULTISPECIES: sensor histidine kinase [unclassified Bradyrhizobium]
MIRLEARHGGSEVAAALEATARRLQVMAEAYDHLSPKRDSSSVNMRFFLNNVVEKVFQSLAPPGPIAFQVVCEDIDLASSHALAIGMITNELVTNSLKYAFPGDRPGHIAVSFAARGGRARRIGVTHRPVARPAAGTAKPQPSKEVHQWREDE